MVVNAPWSSRNPRDAAMTGAGFLALLAAALCSRAEASDGDAAGGAAAHGATELATTSAVTTIAAVIAPAHHDGC